MRLWSLHPSYLDNKGLLACWRESLLAQKVLKGATRGYRNHPQLQRFRQCGFPKLAIGKYLMCLYFESLNRDWEFNHKLIDSSPYFSPDSKLPVNYAQVLYEFDWLLSKVKVRDSKHFSKLIEVREYQKIFNPLPHPLFRIIPGPIEGWERPKQ